MPLSAFQPYYGSRRRFRHPLGGFGHRHGGIGQRQGSFGQPPQRFGQLRGGFGGQQQEFVRAGVFGGQQQDFGGMEQIHDIVNEQPEREPDMVLGQ